MVFYVNFTIINFLKILLGNTFLRFGILVGEETRNPVPHCELSG